MLCLCLCLCVAAFCCLIRHAQSTMITHSLFLFLLLSSFLLLLLLFRTHTPSVRRTHTHVLLPLSHINTLSFHTHTLAFVARASLCVRGRRIRDRERESERGFTRLSECESREFSFSRSCCLQREISPSSCKRDTFHGQRVKSRGHGANRKIAGHVIIIISITCALADWWRVRVT